MNKSDSRLKSESAAKNPCNNTNETKGNIKLSNIKHVNSKSTLTMKTSGGLIQFGILYPQSTHGTAPQRNPIYCSR